MTAANTIGRLVALGLVFFVTSAISKEASSTAFALLGQEDDD